MKKWMSSLALASAFVATFGVLSASAGATRVLIEPQPNAVVVEPQSGAVIVQPQPGGVVVQPQPSVVVPQPVPPMTVVQTQPDVVIVPNQAWCAGTYSPGLGSNFGPCPSVPIVVR
jgi:hypothetical protein